MSQTQAENTTAYSNLVNDEIELADLLRVLWRYRTLLAGSILVAFILGIVYALLAQPMYKTHLLMAPYDQQNSGPSSLARLGAQLGGLASLSGISLDSAGQNVDTYMAQIKSRKFTEEFLEEKNILPILFSDQWNKKTSNWKTKPSTEMIHELFSQILSVKLDTKTGLVNLAITYKDPELAAKWSNELVASFNQHIRERTISEAQKSIHFLEQQIEKTRVVDMKEILYRLIEKQVQTINLAQVRQEYAFKVIDPAVIPDKKVKPKKRLIVIASVFVGMMFGFIAVFLNEFFYKNFQGYRTWLSQIKGKYGL